MAKRFGISGLYSAMQLTNVRFSFQSRLILLAVVSAWPASVLALFLLWSVDYPAVAQWSATVLLVAFNVATGYRVLSRIRYPLQTLHNAVLALREGDYSVRVKAEGSADEFGQLVQTVNGLGERLRQQRLAVVEATTLVRKVIEEIPTAVFTFDQHQRLQLINRAGERILEKSSERVVGITASELGLATWLEGGAVRAIHDSMLGKEGRWEIRRIRFRESGAPHHLLVIQDISQALREEERQAWQRLIRVMAHELNNSLAPIQSLSTSLVEILSEETLPNEWREELTNGLEIILARSEALGRFIAGYGKLARLQLPSKRMTDLGELIRRSAALEQRVPILVLDRPRIMVFIDPDQIEQVIINLTQNAADAVLANGELDFREPPICVSWMNTGREAEIRIEDRGPGIANTANLFVPFFTTKPGGSGIGLALCREIVEAHGGSITLQNSVDGSGCQAQVVLPLR